MESHLSFFFYGSCLLCPKISLLIPSLQIFSVIFFLKFYTFGHFIFRSMIQVTSLSKNKSWSYYFCTWISKCSSTICWGLFPPLNFCGTVVKYQLTTYVWVYFWVLYSIPLIHMLTLGQNCLDHCSFKEEASKHTRSLEIR